MTPEQHAHAFVEELGSLITDGSVAGRGLTLMLLAQKHIAAAVAEERERILGEFEAWAQANEHQGQCAAMIRGIIGLLRARQP